MSGPVLLIDWGIGGLSVYREVKARLPKVQCVYIADSGFTPYGKVAAPELAARLGQIITAARAVFGVKRVLLACNAASTVIAELLANPALAGIRVSGMIEPGIALIQDCGARRIGVIGGQRTIAAGIFSSRLRPLGLTITERVAQPLSALVEKGVLSGPTLVGCLEEILSPLKGVEALLLACTHYPAVADQIANLLPGTRILDPAARAASELAREISDLSVLLAVGSDVFITSGDLVQTRAAAWLAFQVEMPQLLGKVASWMPQPPPATHAPTESARTLQTARRPLLTLRLLFSGDAGVSVRPGELLAAGAVAIGRAVEPGISVPADRRASRHHATVDVSADETVVTVTDQGSKNGLFVNGLRVTAAPLHDGDLLRLGDSFFVLRREPIDATVDTPIDGVVGISPALRALRRELRLLAPTRLTVLLLGETGTGKEVCAQALHRLSERHQQPLVVLDGGAVPRSLIESELFGHDAGAFTGAQRSRQGLFEQASGGTLFIDELGELPLDLQPMLLRAIAQGTIRRAGGTAPLRVDVRVIAATNRDLLHEVESKHFRADLYARLAEVALRLPPLRERREDILPLLLHALGDNAARLSPELVDALLLHPWPFNVREVVKLAAELRLRSLGTAVLDLEHIGHRLRPAVGSPPSAPLARPPGPIASPPLADSARRRMEPATRLTQPSRDELQQLLATATGGISEIARQLGCSRKQVYRWLDLHGLRAERLPAGDDEPSGK